MKIPIIDLDNGKIGEKEIPKQFLEDIRPDLIYRAVITIQKNRRQPYGAKPDAGKRASAKLSRRRRDYRGAYGFGISRVPRKILSRRGTRMNWVGAFAPGTVGGREAHPPKAGKILTKKINKKERRKAIRSALSATLIKDIVEKRGHKIPENYPFVIENKFENLSGKKDLKLVLERLGFKEELKRAFLKVVRGGRGKLRARRYKRKVGPLFVVSDNCKLMKLGNSVGGVSVVNVKNLNTELLAPGTQLGRLTIFTEKALDRLEKEGLFL